MKALKELEKGTIVSEKQGESPTAYASMLTKEMGKIDWTKDAESIERLVRGYVYLLIPGRARIQN